MEKLRPSAKISAFSALSFGYRLFNAEITEARRERREKQGICRTCQKAVKKALFAVRY